MRVNLKPHPLLGMTTGRCDSEWDNKTQCKKPQAGVGIDVTQTSVEGACSVWRC